MASYSCKNTPYLGSFLVLWSILLPSALGVVDWIYPSDADTGLKFNYKDVVYFTWTSSIASPWMNLWCAPSHTEKQSSIYVYHNQVPTNGTNPQSFDYDEYDKQGICHMQLENLSGDDFANTPTFDLTSDDSVEPKTYGLDRVSSLGGTAVTPTTLTLIMPVTTGSTKSASSSPSSSSTSSSATSASSSSVSSPPPTTSPSTSPSPTSLTPFPSPSPPPSSLSTGAKAGISIGSVFCALLLLTIVLLLFRNRYPTKQFRRRQAREQEQVLQQGYRYPKYVENGWLAARGLHEVSGVGRPSELHGTARAELESRGMG